MKASGRKCLLVLCQSNVSRRHLEEDCSDQSMQLIDWLQCNNSVLIYIKNLYANLIICHFTIELNFNLVDLSMCTHGLKKARWTFY